MEERYSRNETGLLMVRWIPEYWCDYTGDSGVDYEPIEFLHIPYRYKCFGKGVK